MTVRVMRLAAKLSANHFLYPTRPAEHGAGDQLAPSVHFSLRKKPPLAN